MDGKINVAITGALTVSRRQAAERIDATENGRFVEYLNFQTHYLVCTKFDSQKARKAARLGTAIISEQELNEHLASGCFPSTALPSVPKRHINNFPEIAWNIKDVPEIVLLTYCDAHGSTSIRRALITGEGYTIGDPDTKWLGGYSGPQFRTWRQDRVVELEILPNAVPPEFDDF